MRPMSSGADFYPGMNRQMMPDWSVVASWLPSLVSGAPGLSNKSVGLMAGRPEPLFGDMPYGSDMVNKNPNFQLGGMSRKQKNKAKADTGIARDKKPKGGKPTPTISSTPSERPKKPKKSATKPQMEY